LVTALRRPQDGMVHERETHPALVGFRQWHNATLFMSGAGGATVAGGGSCERERAQQWWACRGIVGAAAVQGLHGGVVGGR
jgi:hypothetical protein